MQQDIGHGRAVVITGASTGIGRAAALELDRAGFRVFAGVRREEDGRSLVAEASSLLEPIILDILNAEHIEAARELVEREVGDDGLYGLVNNAGVAVGGTWEFIEFDDVRYQLEVNFFAQVAVTRAFLELLRQGRGRVVLTSSVAGFFSMGTSGPYAASKHALEAFADSLRRELHNSGVEVIVLEPGSIATEIWSKARERRDERLQNLPQRAIELYGELGEKMMAFWECTASRAVPAALAGNVVYKALTSRKPKTRYLVGHDAVMLRLVTRLLPDRALDVIYRKILDDAHRKAQT